MTKNILNLSCQRQIKLFFLSSCLWGLQTSVIQAQIIPDNTLGAESSIVNQINDKLQQIDGGAVRGSNLFHSFQEFSIQEGNSAYFTNPTGIFNILTRVTGDNPSHILGTLGVLGNANLYLINPNGIIFGANAQLDLTGSFYASTSPSLILPDGSLFSATNPQAPPLLTVTATAPIGFVMEGQTGDIINQGNLQVGQGQTLYINGRSVTNTGNLTAEGGNIFLLGDNLTIDGTATLDVSATTGGGNIYLGGDIRRTGNLPTALSTYIGENVNLNADGLLTGNGGNVIIYAEDLTTFRGTVTARGGVISGDGGFVEVSGKENLIFQGDVNASAVNGLAGTLLIDPENLTIKDGAGENEVNIIYEENLENLSGDINVILEADNNITIENLADDELTFQAGSGEVTFTADGDSDGVGDVIMNDVVDSIRALGK
ncbi:MAG: filamentous hemagglutinin N-terminal domain-containing protein, partial [Microcystaceae cyanobacterium]